MKHFIDNQIVQKFKSIWETEYFCPDIEVLENTKQSVRVKVSTSYEAPGLTFAQLCKLSEFFDTKNINDDAKFSHGGCATCDYGSEYGFVLTFRPDDNNKED